MLVAKIISTCTLPIETISALHLPALFFGLGNVGKKILATPASFAFFSAEEVAKTVFCAHQAYKDYKDRKGCKIWLPQVCLAIAAATAGAAAGFAASESAALEAFVAPEFAAALATITGVHVFNEIKAMTDEKDSWWEHLQNNTYAAGSGIAAAAVVGASIAKNKENCRGSLLIGAGATVVTAGATIVTAGLSLLNKLSLFCHKDAKQIEKTEAKETEALIANAQKVFHGPATTPTLV